MVCGCSLQRPGLSCYRTPDSGVGGIKAAVCESCTTRRRETAAEGAEAVVATVASWR